MKYMIHACPKRMWYVNDFLVPSMLDQGISMLDIRIWNDTEGLGNLLSCMKAFESLGRFYDSTWHLQDDVVISKTFRERAEYYRTEGVVTGFCHDRWDNHRNTGYVHPDKVWLAFQCIHIPDVYASECADWFFRYAQHRPDLQEKIRGGRDDDIIWRRFLQERHPDIWCMNVYPAMAEHVDWLIGGTTINFEREQKRGICRAAYWDEDDVIDDLKSRLEVYRKGDGPNGIDRNGQSANTAKLSKSAVHTAEPDFLLDKRSGGGHQKSNPRKQLGADHG